MATLVALSAAAVALADTIAVDNDEFSPGNQHQVEVTAAPGTQVNAGAQLIITYKGNKHLVPGSSVKLVLGHNDLPAGATVTDVDIDVPNPWQEGGQITGNSDISFAAPAIAGNYTYTVKWDVASSECQSSGSCITGSDNFLVKLTVSQPAPPPPVNHAPTVKTAAADAIGIEGDTLQSSGAFEDQDGDALALTANNTVGTFTDYGDGTWSWSLATNDDVPAGTIAVTANDGRGGAATDSFDYEAKNANPALGPFSLGFASDDPSHCSPSPTVSYTDVGTADTHTVQIAWGDGTSDSVSTLAGPQPYTPGGWLHTYPAAGQYTASIGVTDDDGGSASNTASAVTVYNKPGGLLPPIHSDGSSRFKRGSTIPLKVQVFDCLGRSVTTLGPQVSLKQINTSGGTQSVNEVVSSSAADSGTTMRYSETGVQYIFNLSSKRSQFNAGQDLTAGLYQVTVSDGTFPAPVSQQFRLVK